MILIKKKIYTIEESDDNCYDLVKSMTKYLYINKDSLSLVCTSSSNENLIINKINKNNPELDIFRIGYGTYTFKFKDATFYIDYNISVEKFPLDRLVTSYKTFTVWFDSAYPESEQVFAEFLKKVSTEDIKDKDKLFVYTCDEYGDWNLYNKLPFRKLDFIYVDDKIKKSITNDIQKFLDSEDVYNRFGMPYKKTFLLTGLAGAGKSSLVKAICNHFNFHLYILSIQKKFDNSSLLHSIKNLDSKSILLIEDIDCLFQKRKSTDETPMLSFSNILNILDGVLYKHGSIIFITTNHPEKLDNALIRIGRIDMIVKFDYPKKEDVRKMFYDMMGLNKSDIKEDFELFYKSTTNMPMSALIGFLFRYRDNWKENISELIDTSNFIKKVVKGEGDNNSMYS